MVDIAAISGALMSIKTAKEIAQAMVGLGLSQAFQTKAIELQGALLDAQSGVFAANEERAALIQRVAEMENKIARLEEWKADAVRYELKEVAPGALAYTVKENARGTEPAHQLCANCYGAGKKSILQTENRTPGRTVVAVCHGCSAEIYIEGGWRPEHGKRR